MAGRVAYVYKRNVGDIASLNILRPYRPTTSRSTAAIPGPTAS